MKKTLIIIAIIFVVLAAGTGAYLLYQSQKKEVSPLAQNPQVPLAIPTTAEEYTTWDDPAEFTFDYPKRLNVNNHEEDKENYAHVELTSADHPGNIIVWVKDTSAKTIEDWVKTTKPVGALDTILDGIPAKKVRVPGTAPKIVTTAIRNGYLYEIEATLDDTGYWSGLVEKIVASFKFKTPQAEQGQSAVSPDTASEEVYSDEEVIE